MYSISIHTGAVAISSALFGQGAGPITLSYVGCTGRETRLSDCPSWSVYCNHNQDAGVRCHMRSGDCNIV